MQKKTLLAANPDVLANTRKMLLTNELTQVLGKRVMSGAKDLKWGQSFEDDTVRIAIQRKLDGAFMGFKVPRDSIDAAGGPYVVIPEETKAMLVLFLLS